MYQIISREWEQALTSIEAHYKDGANRQEAINLLQEFKGRTRTLLTNNWRQKDPQVAALGRQFDELVEQVASGSNEIKNSLQGDSIGDNYWSEMHNTDMEIDIIDHTMQMTEWDKRRLGKSWR